MNNMFINCTSLQKLPEFPAGVQEMEKTFENCTSLQEVPAIPNSVTNLIKTFYGCTNLKGIIEINANVTGIEIVRNEKNDIQIDYFCIFKNAVTEDIVELTGTCCVIEEIVESSNNPNIKVLSTKTE